MQIHLKQDEITTAIKQYITRQGIPLAGKKVDVVYTATRSGAGIVVDISIENSVIEGIPGFETEDQPQPAPAATVTPIKPAVFSTPLPRVVAEAANLVLGIGPDGTVTGMQVAPEPAPAPATVVAAPAVAEDKPLTKSLQQLAVDIWHTPLEEDAMPPEPEPLPTPVPAPAGEAKPEVKTTSLFS
jgi:hypothetical protein